MDSFKKLFSYYLIFLLVLIIYFLLAVHNSTVNNSMAEWVINYQGGFTRRGFLGEIVFQISQLFDFQLRKTFLILQIFIYIFYFYFIYKLFSKIKYNFVFALAIFSPLFFIFSLSELEALGRKDILMFLVFILNFLIYEKFRSININYFFFLFTFPIVFLTHEIYIIYTVYFLFFFIILEKEFSYKSISKIVFLIIYILIFLILLNSVEYDQDNLNLLCKNLLQKSGEKCGLAPLSMIIDINSYQSELDWKTSHIIRYIFIFLIGFSALIFILFFSKINEEKTNVITNKINLKIIFLISIVPSILPFLTAVDSGRYMSMAYTFPCIFYFGFLRLNRISFDYEKANILISGTILKFKKYKIMFLILVCFTWTPKAVYHEDIGSFPLYRTLIKTKNFVEGIKSLGVN